ncbi:PREDICTED: basic 7S globulin 2-like [Camelina sativa]|uniref:Basic 7S globulin 2-like n=1 Tax=Camelina sativa TaxID=90675 RepID=A0ABM0T4C4_CAMSA|nr:PREDICTED: basic 7S globulin 2-like [Camelina sativa]
MSSLTLTRLILFFSIFAAITLKSNSQYLLPITKHEPTNQFYTTLNLGSGGTSSSNLLLDLETNLTLVNWNIFNPPLFVNNLVICKSSTCNSIPGNDCDDNGLFCVYRQSSLLGQNVGVIGAVVQATVNISTTDGGNLLSPFTVHPFTFSCAGEEPLQALPPPVSGVLSLSPVSSSFTKQVTLLFGYIPKFSLCLPSSGTGHLYIATVNYLIPPFNSDNPIRMTLTPLKNIYTGNYLIDVKSIYVDGTPLSFNPNLLAGGAKLSTVVPYTVLLTDIYNALAQSFTLKAKTMGISKVQAIAPFKDCFDARAAGKNMTGPNVPVIDIGVPGRGGEVKWSFHGANTVVNVTETVMCLAFLDGGQNPKDLLVIGTHQLQDHMLEIDFSTSLMGLSDSLLLHNTSCSTWPSQN